MFCRPIHSMESTKEVSMLLDQITHRRLTTTEVVRRFRDAWLQQSPERIPQVWSVLAVHEMPYADEFNVYK